MESLPTPILLLTLAVASVVDLRRRVIPNWLTGLAALLGLVLAWQTGGAASIGLAVLSGSLAALPFLTAALIRPEGMGMGDVKLVAVLGFYLGEEVWLALAVGLALAGLTGVLISLGQRRPLAQVALPLAPFLALGAGLVLAAGSPLLQ